MKTCGVLWLVIYASEQEMRMTFTSSGLGLLADGSLSVLGFGGRADWVMLRNTLENY